MSRPNFDFICIMYVCKMKIEEVLQWDFGQYVGEGTMESNNAFSESGGINMPN